MMVKKIILLSAIFSYYMFVNSMEKPNDFKQHKRPYQYALKAEETKTLDTCQSHKKLKLDFFPLSELDNELIALIILHVIDDILQESTIYDFYLQIKKCLWRLTINKRFNLIVTDSTLNKNILNKWKNHFTQEESKLNKMEQIQQLSKVLRALSSPKEYPEIEIYISQILRLLMANPSSEMFEKLSVYPFQHLLFFNISIAKMLFEIGGTYYLMQKYKLFEEDERVETQFYDQMRKFLSIEGNDLLKKVLLSHKFKTACTSGQYRADELELAWGLVEMSQDLELLNSLSELDFDADCWGLDIDKNSWGEMGEVKPPLISACQKENAKGVDILLKHNAWVEVIDNKIRTPLLIASMYGHIQVVELLLNNRAYIDHQDLHEQTALMLASRNGHLKVVKLLVDAGADLNLVDENDDTAQKIALDNDHNDIVNEINNALN